jgi:hypothetical protein
MSYPDHPQEIVLKNEFYPKGLKEIDIWNYYIRTKSLILEQTENRDLMFEMIINGQRLIKRKSPEGGFLRLTPGNYEHMIHGRLLAIHAAMGQYEYSGIVDIDCDNFNLAREATEKTYEYIMERMPLIKKADIRFTGKTGFHIHCDFGKKVNIDIIRMLLLKSLSYTKELSDYTVGFKRKPGIPNLDLSPNKFKGNHIVLGSLSLIGLRCMEVRYNELDSFQKNKARI